MALLARWLLVAIVLLAVISSVAVAQNDESNNAIAAGGDDANDVVVPPPLKRSKKGGKLRATNDINDEEINANDDNEVVPVPGRKKGRRAAIGENETKGKGKRASKTIANDADEQVDMNDVIDNGTDSCVHPSPSYTHI